MSAADLLASRGQMRGGSAQRQPARVPCKASSQHLQVGAACDTDGLSQRTFNSGGQRFKMLDWVAAQR